MPTQMLHLVKNNSYIQKSLSTNIAFPPFIHNRTFIFNQGQMS